jgi:peptidoglycan/xylan/chitin deacetylase (PgdA/CDA1 family)
MTMTITDVPVLMYHEITSAPSGSARLAVSPRSFAAQVSYLHDAGFTSVTAGDLAGALAGGKPLPARPVVLTFDDGFADFHDVALPVLLKHGFTATLFMTTGWIRDAGTRAGSPPGAMLSWSQLSEVAAAGIEVGGHSHQHPQLDQLSSTAAMDELVASKRILEDGLAKAVPGMAYPFGYSSAGVRKLAADAGYSYAYAVGNRGLGRELDQYALPRLTVGRSTRLATYHQIVASRNLGVIFLKDRSLTRGWAVARKARSVINRHKIL